MPRTADNQAYYVLGHRTPNILDRYTLSRKLGQGQFETTYLCTEVSTGVNYACKSILKRKLISKEDVEDVRREIQIMHHLAGHENIATIRGAYEDSLYVHIVMDLCSGGELFDRIIQRGHYSEREAAELTKIIVGVVESCHSLGVMHRDLKPEIFLLVNKDDDFSLKAIDFGLSVFFEPGQIFNDVVGSPYYVAPEVLFKHYGPEADVWSAGVILYILLSGVPPFWAETQQGIFDAVLKGYIDFDSDPWPAISDSAKDLILKMLCSSPSERLTAHEVLRHPWICENGVAPDRALDRAILSRLKQFSAMNKIKKKALKIIAESLSEEEIAGLRAMFEEMDTDNSGVITFDELRAGLRTCGSTLSDTEIQYLMEAAGVDNRGTIDYGELIAASCLDREEHHVYAFQYFDKDGTTIDELQSPSTVREVLEEPSSSRRASFSDNGNASDIGIGGLILPLINPFNFSRQVPSREVPSSSSDNAQYQVFINFRGDELRNSFVGFLAKAMRMAMINVFTDEVEVRGTNLQYLFKRIKESRVALAIFSERYTESCWCLDELVKMNDQMKKGKLVVIPVFYRLDATMCKRLYGAFGDNFRRLEWEYRSETVRIQRWKEALSSVSNNIGLTSDIRSDDSRFVDVIVEEVKRVLRVSPWRDT